MQSGRYPSGEAVFWQIFDKLKDLHGEGKFANF